MGDFLWCPGYTSRSLQELMPGWGSEERNESDKGRAGSAAVKSWLMKNLTKKKRDAGPEEGATASAEPHLVKPSLPPTPPFPPLKLVGQS